MNWQLTVARGRRKGQSIPITRFPFLIGRQAGCHMRPGAASVSDRHCELVIRQGRLVVHCLAEGPGTFVNGRPVKVAAGLRPGDHLRIGPLEFLVGLAAPAPRPVGRRLDEDAIGG